jgi:hypothetical protein
VRRAAALVAGLLLAACRTLPGPLAPLPPEDPRPARLLASLEERAAERRALRGRAELEVESERFEVPPSTRQVLVLERPDRLRVEILGFLNQTQAVLTTSGGRYELFVADGQRYESGMAYRGLLWDVARIDLEPREVVELLLGVPLADRRLALRRALATPEGGVQLEVAGPPAAGTQTFVFDAAGRLRRMRREPEGLDVRFGAYAPVDGAAVAHTIVVEHAGTRAELSLHDVELNPDLPEGLFELRPAAGVEGR